MAEAKLQAQLRTEKGKQAAKHCRQQGLIPGTLYGPGETPTSYTINLKEFLTLLHTYGRNVVVDLSLGGPKDFKAFIYEIQHDPISGDIIHVDMKHISLQDKIRTTVSVQLAGIPIGVKVEGGILEHILHTVEIFCLPTDIPESITLDVSSLHTGALVHVKDLPHENFDIMTEPEATVVHIVTPKLRGEEGVGEAGAGEPEVIGGKKVEE
jgi:large subunit ribosomal protein L25